MSKAQTKQVVLLKAVQIKSASKALIGLQDLSTDIADELIAAGLAVEPTQD